MRRLPAGASAWLVDLDDLAQVLALHRLVRERVPGVIDVVPGARTLLVTTGPDELDDLGRMLDDLAADLVTGAATDVTRGPVIEVPVVYDGPDLGEVAELAGLTPEEVVEAHAGQLWQGAFGGFAPGFTYVVPAVPDAKASLEVARRSSPRARVEPGSVGLAGEFSGIYPSASPGGWQLIGRTDVVLWDVAAAPPALIAPGELVRFVPVGEPA